MCQTYSCLVCRDVSVYGQCEPMPWNPSHTAIAAARGLPEDGRSELHRAKVEIVPPGEDYARPLAEWMLTVDEASRPKWWGDRHKSAARAACAAWHAAYVVPALAEGAVIRSDGTREWYIDGVPGRAGDGPAVIWADGTRMWYVGGVFKLAVKGGAQ